ncbi:hypothetical protein RRG08_043532 [Elysia crispata]|uniref:Transposase n=1 Tax=Elysia crispata TaxID=231223 RepID=A0AAE0YFW1_9GAST|nr:hypothetical protein RRG08_043532 [Elysia crispata]
MILTNDQTQVCPGLDKQKTLCDQQINVCHARARSNPTSILSPSAASLQELEFGSLKHFRMISQMRSSGDDPVRMGSETLQDSQSDSGRSVIPGRVNFLRRFQTEQNDFLGRIITGDETLVYSWDPETKRQSAEWRDFDEPRPEKVRRKQGALKVMHMIFFDMNGVILRWPVPIGTTINAQYYKKVLQDKLRPAIRKKRPGLLESGILFHHDNAPVHTARAVTDVLAGYKWELLERPRYSPDLAPSPLGLEEQTLYRNWRRFPGLKVRRVSERGKSAALAGSSSGPG